MSIMSTETDDEEYNVSLTEDGIKRIIEIDDYFRNTDYTLEEIAEKIGVDVTATRLLYYIGERFGVLDILEKDRPDWSIDELF